MVTGGGEVDRGCWLHLNLCMAGSINTGQHLCHLMGSVGMGRDVENGGIAFSYGVRELVVRYID